MVPLSSVRVKDVLANLDGQGRNDRIRYDTPSFGGFTLATSLIEGDVWDLSGKYSAEYDGYKVTAALGYSDDVGSDLINGSASILLDNGLNFTLAAGERDSDSGNVDPSFYYFKLGYRVSLTTAGKTSFSVDYHETDDAKLSGDEASSYGFQMVQRIDDWATEAYLGLRNYELSRPGTEFEDVTAILAGARVKF